MVAVQPSEEAFSGGGAMNPMRGKTLLHVFFESDSNLLAGIEYVSADQLIEINRRVLKEIRVKKAGSHKTASRKKLESIVEKVMTLEGGAFERGHVCWSS